jgi:hypothetical protein
VKRRYNFTAVQIPGELDDFGLTLHARLKLNKEAVQHHYKETSEAVTHQFHRDHALQVAILLADAYISGGGTCDGAPFPDVLEARHAIRGCSARPCDRPQEALIYADHKISNEETILLLGEDKTNPVMEKARTLIDNIVENQLYEYPTSIKEANAGIRVLTQVRHVVYRILIISRSLQGLEPDGCIQTRGEVWRLDEQTLCVIYIFVYIGPRAPLLF